METVTNIKEKKMSYDELKKLNPLTKWEDINEGDNMIIPPFWIYERRDINVLKKYDTFIFVEILNEMNKKTSIFKSEISAKFLVKKQNVW